MLAEYSAALRTSGATRISWILEWSAGGDRPYDCGLAVEIAGREVSASGNGADEAEAVRLAVEAMSYQLAAALTALTDSVDETDADLAVLVGDAPSSGGRS